MAGGIYRGDKQAGRDLALAPLRGTGVAQPDIKVVANPNDPYVHTFKDNDTNNIFKQLSGLAKATADAAAPVAQEANAQGERTALAAPPKPQIDANGDPILDASGKIKIEATGWEGKLFNGAYMAGYEKVDGAFKSTQYHQEITTWMADHKNDPAPQFQEGLNAIRQKYMGGMVSDDQLDGFLPRAAAAEQDVLKQHNDHQIKVTRDELAAKTSVVMQTQVNDIFIPALAKISFTDSNGLVRPMVPADLQTLVGIKAFQANRAAFQANVDGPLKDLHTRMLSELAPNYTKAEVSGMYVDQLVSLAGQTTSPELLDALSLPDSTGRSIKNYNDARGNPLMGQVDGAYQTIENKRFSITQQLAHLEREAAVDRLHASTSAWTNEVSKLYKLPPEEHARKLIEMEDSIDEIVTKGAPYVTKADVSDLYAILDSKKKRGMHPAQTGTQDAADFYMDVSRNRASVAKVLRNWQKYSEQDYDKYLAKASEQEHMRVTKDAEKKDLYFTPMKMTELGYHAFEGNLNPKDSLGTGVYDDQGQFKVRDAQKMYAREIHQYGITHGDKSPAQDDLDKIQAKVDSKFPPYIPLTEKEVLEWKDKMVAAGDFPHDTSDATIAAWWPGRPAIYREVVDRLRGKKTPGTPLPKKK